MLKFWLTEQQSAGQILRVLEEKAAAVREGRQSEAPYIVFSLALQPLVSLAHNNGLEVQVGIHHDLRGPQLNSLCYPLLQETAERLAGFLRWLGADLVLDTKLAEDWSLLEQQQEMLQRYRARHNARYI